MHGRRSLSVDLKEFDPEIERTLKALRVQEKITNTCEEKVLSALKGLESMTQILDSHTQSIAKLETQIGQLANAISRRDEGKLPSHPIENPRANYHEQANTVITIRNGKLVDNKVGEPIKDSESNNNETREFL
ncbi:hypothetical protein M9H77_35808 [Catharanthus roseus]|uniref:Uncharacterized protein n=1 Tax=Catharanthus roseus TaxID=4058 RepID=A0ACB9ZQD9_CATRO|nr:hypothetical protein M9H77_35808 [Catharanthus roseus]